MILRKKLPVALTIAGSDSGGGAGVQADLKTFAALGVHGTSAIACLTAQNPRRVLAVEPCSPKMLRQQIEAVFEELPPAAVKTGMLFSPGNIKVVVNFFRTPHSALRTPPLVVDPVMVSTSGVRLLQPAAEKILREKVLPLATLVTPNLDEAEILADQKISSPEDLRSAAREIRSRYGCAVLVKGGHLKNSREALDVFLTAKPNYSCPRHSCAAFPRTAPAAPIPPRFAPRWRLATTCRTRWRSGKISSRRRLPAATASENILRSDRLTLRPAPAQNAARIRLLHQPIVRAARNGAAENPFREFYGLNFTR